MIDTGTNAVIASIPAGLTATVDRLSPDGSRLYVTNSDSGTVLVIDTDTNAVTATIELGLGPQIAALSPDGTRLYVNDGTLPPGICGGHGHQRRHRHNPRR